MSFTTCYRDSFIFYLVQYDYVLKQGAKEGSNRRRQKTAGPSGFVLSNINYLDVRIREVEMGGMRRTHRRDEHYALNFNWKL
jgi:hypothetical protein